MKLQRRFSLFGALPVAPQGRSVLCFPFSVLLGVCYNKVMKRLLALLLCCVGVAAGAAEAPRYAIGPVLWEAGNPEAAVCTLRAEAIEPAAPGMLPGLQPSVQWSATVNRAPIDLKLMLIGPEVIAGATVENNCAILRGALLPAFREAGVPVILRGPLDDLQRTAAKAAIPPRAIAVRVLNYAETVQPPAPSMTLPLEVRGRATINLAVVVSDYVSGDILLTEPVEVSVDIEARLDDANPQTSPIEPSLLVDRVAEAVAKTVKALPEEP